MSDALLSGESGPVENTDPAPTELERLREENANFRTWGMIEVAIRNPNVRDFMEHWERRAEKAEAALAAGTAREARLEAALRASVTAIDDWLVTYASDMCDPARVAEAQNRIGEFGTLAYIADVQERNRSALTPEAPK